MWWWMWKFLCAWKSWRSHLFNALRHGGHHSSKETLSVSKLVKKYCWKAQSLCCYRFMDKTQHYLEEVTRWTVKMGRNHKVRLKSQRFCSSDWINILSSSQNFKSAADTNGTHEGATMWLLHQFMNKGAWAPPSACIGLLRFSWAC